MITRDRLNHAIEAYVSIRSTAHAAALNAIVEQLFDEIARLQAAHESDGASLEEAAQLMGTMAVQAPAQQTVLDAARNLAIAYRRLGGLEVAFDEPLLTVEKLLITAGPPVDVPAVVRCEGCTSACVTGQCARQSIAAGVQP